jgi:hypothetical protein
VSGGGGDPVGKTSLTVGATPLGVTLDVALADRDRPIRLRLAPLEALRVANALRRAATGEGGGGAA